MSILRLALLIAFFVSSVLAAPSDSGLATVQTEIQRIASGAVGEVGVGDVLPVGGEGGAVVPGGAVGEAPLCAGLHVHGEAGSDDSVGDHSRRVGPAGGRLARAACRYLPGGAAASGAPSAPGAPATQMSAMGDSVAAAPGARRRSASQIVRSSV